MNLDEMLVKVHDLPAGDYAEAGVWKGFTAETIARAMRPGTGLWLLDSFEGHGEPCAFDDAELHPRGRYADTGAEAVYDLINPIVEARDSFIWMVKGFIPKTLNHNGISHQSFRLVNIDLDHYLPTKAACEFFKPRMVLGGIIRFDDYNFAECPGATKAIDEVFGKENVLSEDYRWVAT